MGRSRRESGSVFQRTYRAGKSRNSRKRSASPGVGFNGAHRFTVRAWSFRSRRSLLRIGPEALDGESPYAGRIFACACKKLRRALLGDSKLVWLQPDKSCRCRRILTQMLSRWTSRWDSDRLATVTSAERRLPVLPSHAPSLRVRLGPAASRAASSGRSRRLSATSACPPLCRAKGR